MISSNLMFIKGNCYGIETIVENTDLDLPIEQRIIGTLHPIGYKNAMGYRAVAYPNSCLNLELSQSKDFIRMDNDSHITGEENKQLAVAWVNSVRENYLYQQMEKSLKDALGNE